MVFSSEKADSNLFEMVRDEFRSIGFKYLEIKEENEVKGHLFIEKKAKRIKEVHFVSGGKSEGIVISFYGDVEVTDKK